MIFTISASFPNFPKLGHLVGRNSGYATTQQAKPKNGPDVSKTSMPIYDVAHPKNLLFIAIFFYMSSLYVDAFCASQICLVAPASIMATEL